MVETLISQEYGSKTERGTGAGFYLQSCSNALYRMPIVILLTPIIKTDLDCAVSTSKGRGAQKVAR